MKSVVVVVVACVAAVSAHMCMLSPPQRGSLVGINEKGADDCFLTMKQCGGRMMGPNFIALKGGQNFTVTFQKNLDHWVKANPGYFLVQWGQEGMTFKQLMKIPDMGEPSLTLYSVNVTIPMDKTGMNYTIQTQYVTMNPKAPPVFYQCGDVMLM